MSETEQNGITEVSALKWLVFRGRSTRLGHRSQDTALPEGNRSGRRCQRGQEPGCRGMDCFMPRPIGPKRLTPGGWGQSPQGRGIARDAPLVRESPDEKKQLIRRLPSEFVRSILRDFNSGVIDAASAAARLDVSRPRLRDRAHFPQVRHRAFPPPAASSACSNIQQV
jgi:hypothetical protein